MSEIFSDFRDQLKKKGYMNEVVTFIDATHLISKARFGSKKHVSVDRRSGLINKVAITPANVTDS